MKILTITSPILALAIIVVACALARRPIARATLNIVVALYLLGYLLAAAGLGLFWVSRMDLPTFDLHYLFGYCVMSLAIAHVWFQWPVLRGFFRRARGRMDGARVSPSGNAGRIVAAVVVSLIAGIFVGRSFLKPGATPKVILMPAAGLKEGGLEMQGLWDLHNRASLSRFAVMISPRWALERPEVFKSFPSQAWIPLPQPRRLAGKSLEETLRIRHQGHLSHAPTLTKEELADILFYTDGVTDILRYPGDTLYLRAAPSAGALYPVNMYVVVQNIEGLSPGVFYYHAAKHALAPVGDAKAAVRVLESTGREKDLQDAPAVFVLTTVFNRTVWKYEDRSYRYVAMDTGHVAGNLTLAAAALGTPASLTAQFDDGLLLEALGADPKEEGAFLVVPLIELEKKPTTDRVTRTPAELPEEGDLIRLSHLASAWRWRGEKVSAAESSPSYKNKEKSPAGIVKLPEGSPAAGDLFEVIQARRSYREFAPRAVTIKDFAGVLTQSYGFMPDMEGNRFLELYVFVRRVESLAPGLYRWRPEPQDLELLAPGDFSGRIYSAGLSQEVLLRAAFVLAWVVDIQKVGRCDGPRDYRYTLLQAGLAGENVYLGAVARGLGVCGVGAFFDTEVDNLLGLQGKPHRSLYLMGVGVRSSS